MNNKFDSLEKILIVHNSKSNLKIIERIISNLSLNVIIAYTFIEALEKLSKNKETSLIIIDSGDNSSSGLEFIQSIENLEWAKDIPILFMTEYAGKEKTFHKNFGVRAIDFIYKPIDYDLLVTKIVIFLTNVSQKKRLLSQSELLIRQKELLSVTIKTLKEGVVTTDQFGTILLINESAANLLGYHQNEIIGNSIINVFSSILETKDNPIKNIFDFEEYDDNERNFDRITIKIEKTKRMIALNATVLSKNNRDIDYIIFVLFDISEKIKIENQLMLAQKMESVGHLAAGIAHEMNTPLQFVSDNTHFLKDAFSDIVNYTSKIKEKIPKETIPEVKKIENEFDIDYLNEEIPVAIDKTLEGIDRVSNIVLAMKNFAHPAGKEKTHTNINNGIKDTITISKNEWKYFADLETDLDNNIPDIFCSPDEINQVILNLVINSAHAIEERLEVNRSPKGKIIIKTEQSDGYLLINISDNGSGIKKENVNKIFDPFFTTKIVGKGTGQGLAIVHDIIVNKHKGQINVDSEIGVGTTFQVKLPVINNK